MRRFFGGGTSLSDKNYRAILLRSLPWLALSPIAFILQTAAKYNPDTVEYLYSQAVYPVLAKITGFIPGMFPFSLAEILLYALILGFFAFVIYSSIIIVKSKGYILKRLLSLVLFFLTVLSVLYFSFYALWGLNYYRLPFAQLAGYDTRPRTKDELVELCEHLVTDANEARSKIKEDENGVFALSYSRKTCFSKVSACYSNLHEDFGYLNIPASTPKGVINSNAMSWLGISGIFSPYTNEANVNGDMPDTYFPVSACHETAHKIGFAREDEANFIAYLACKYSGDTDFRYSGSLFALVYAMKELNSIDSDAYYELCDKYDEGVKRDLRAEADFWSGYESEVREVNARVNDTYLKYNSQQDGIKSYNNMVQLLIEEYENRPSEN